MKVLFASSEVWPLIKTGGLADVAHSLPHALKQEGVDVRLVIPAYREVLQQFDDLRVLGWLKPLLDKAPQPLRIVAARHPEFDMPIWLVDSQALFDRPGNPYSGEDGRDWPDNAERFASFSYAVSQVACGGLDPNWRADVVHCNDWQTGMVCAFLENQPAPPKRVFTIHNLAYGGYFSKEEFSRLQLPWEWWSEEGIEFYGGFSMLKAGLVYADVITTVSPTYAREICTPEYGNGMDGVLRAREHKLSGILNGIDMDTWDPGTDPLLEFHYTVDTIQPGKTKNKAALLEAFGRKPDTALLQAPLLGTVGRLAEQKGVDMLLEVIPDLVAKTDANLVIIGSGDEQYARRLQDLAARFPERVMVYIGYSEPLAHLLEAGADLFLMPSRFEPCGLNQLYSMRYGTPPVVHHTGGLADTVCNASPANLDRGKATGIVFKQPTARALYNAILRAIKIYRDRPKWHKLQKQAMRQSFDWKRSAQQYLALYQQD